jgi:hypothetical protein
LQRGKGPVNEQGANNDGEVVLSFLHDYMSVRHGPTRYRVAVLTSWGRDLSLCPGPTRYRMVVLTSWDRSMSVCHGPTRYRVVVLTSYLQCERLSHFTKIHPLRLASSRHTISLSKSAAYLP